MSQESCCGSKWRGRKEGGTEGEGKERRKEEKKKGMEGREEEGGREGSDLEKAWKIGPHSHPLQSKGTFLSHR